MRTRSGIREQGSLVELHMTTGRDLQPGGTLEMATTPSGFPVGRVPNLYEGTVGGITLHHPNAPAASGLELRMAVVGVDATLTTWGASQPEGFTIRE